MLVWTLISRARKHWISAIHPAETVPLVLAIGAIIQSLVFIGAQSTGLSSLYINGCAMISQFVFPGIESRVDEVGCC